MSEFLENKIKHAFELHDFTKDGVVDQDDLLEHGRRIANAKGYGDDAVERAELVEESRKMWAGLEQMAGATRLDQAAWVALTMQMTADAAAYRAFLEGATATTFGHMDLNGDGWVCLEEFRTHLEIYGVDGSKAESCFAKVDSNADGRLSVSEVVDAIFEFYTSTDPEAPGNWFFGPVAG